MFPVLLKKAVEAGFQFDEVYADRAYNGRPNFQAAAALGIVPYIPFKSNSTGQARGVAIYHKMFLYWLYHREDFDSHYGQRAQVESSFGSFKQKIGETIASRTMASQVNEILSSAIAYNLMILVRQMFERGLLPDFLERDPAAVGVPPDLRHRAAPDPRVDIGGPTQLPVSKPDLFVSKPYPSGDV